MPENITDFYQLTRDQSTMICKDLSPEDCALQSMEDASPVKWHLAHTTWFFETFILEKFEPSFKPFNPSFRYLFNSYYESVGEQFPRGQRGLMSRPSLEEIKDYRLKVDKSIKNLLHTSEKQNEIKKLTEIGLHHEQQHQELMLTDLKHLFSYNPLHPLLNDSITQPTPMIEPAGWISMPSSLVDIGHAEDEFCFDNEQPRHRQWIERFEIATTLVTNADYLKFIESGGYQNPHLWLSEGWSWIKKNEITAPLYWRKMENTWYEFSFEGLKKIEPQKPVLHISFFEADAFARWADARLPTEFEWEYAARTSPHLKNLFGTCWQWTSSSYHPYPGYQPSPGALGEYNGKFMVNQYVLRGSSLATPENHSRMTYRNFFPTQTRWQFAGIRLARSQKGKH